MPESSRHLFQLRTESIRRLWAIPGEIVLEMLRNPRDSTEFGYFSRGKAV